MNLSNQVIRGQQSGQPGSKRLTASIDPPP